MHARHALASSVLPALLLLTFLISIAVTLLVPSSPSRRRLPFFRTADPAPAPQLVADDASGGTARAGGCDYSDGEWVRDDPATTAAAYGEDCPFLDPGFRCASNGRKDTSFRHWRWQPRGGSSCRLPKFNGSEMLERSRNGRIVFAGDSIGRNQWESMLCMLASAVPPDAANGTTSRRIYERSGKPLSRHRGYLSMVFADYNLSVEYYRAPFLVLLDRFDNSSNSTVRARGAVRLDALPRHAARWAGADVIVLNTGHWWNPHKTIKSGNYFMVGDRFNVTTDVGEAFKLSMETVKRWAGTTARLANPNGHVFFRSFSPSHYGGGGINGTTNKTWDTGGSCAGHRDPAASSNGGGESDRSSWMMEAMGVSSGTKEKKGDIVLLNVTYMTGLRRDGHPSRHREPGTPPGAPEDCSHWCLPGVPDAWNQLLYAQLLSMGYDARKKRSNKST